MGAGVVVKVVVGDDVTVVVVVCVVVGDVVKLVV